jgi:glutamate--cysteine ligase
MGKRNYGELGEAVRNAGATRDLAQLFVGLELETHRINRETGLMSENPFPKRLIALHPHAFIKNDFAQSQAEIVTQTLNSAELALDYLAGYRNALATALSDDEALWPYSMPPHLSDDMHEFHISTINSANEDYLRAVEQNMTYPRKEIVSGVHVNIGLNLDVIASIYAAYFSDRFDSQVDFQNIIYAKIAQGFLKYRWLITLLFGATPFALKNYFDPNHQDPVAGPVRSIRSSSIGFSNPVATQVSYASVAEYAADIAALVANGTLIQSRSFYGFTRFRGADVEKLTTEGTKYLEIRMFDVNPFQIEGVNNLQLQFVEMLFTYLLMVDFTVDQENVDEEIAAAMAKNEAVALENPLNRSQFADEAIAFLRELQSFAKDNLFIDVFSETLIHWLEVPETSISGRMVAKYPTADSLTQALIAQANAFQDLALDQSDISNGFIDLPERVRRILQRSFRDGDEVRLLDRQTGTFEIIHEGDSYILAGDQLIRRYTN